MGLKALKGAVARTREPEQPLVFPQHSTGWSVVIALAITTIVSYGTTQYLFGVLEVPLATTFAWSRAELSGAYALSLLVAGVLGVPVGYLVDRSGARILTTVGSVLAGCALIGLSQISQLWQFYLYWSGGLGIAMALILYPVTFTVVTSWFVLERAKAFAVLTLVGGLASPIFIPLSGWLIPQIGWRTTLFWYGVLHLAIAVPLHAWLVRRAPDRQDVVNRAAVIASPSEDASTARQALTSVRFWLLTAWPCWEARWSLRTRLPTWSAEAMARSWRPRWLARSVWRVCRDAFSSICSARASCRKRCW